MNKIMLFVDTSSYEVMISKCLKVAKETDSRLEIIDVKLGECEILRQYDIKTTPTLVIVSSWGEVIKRTGIIPESHLRSLFEGFR